MRWRASRPSTRAFPALAARLREVFIAAQDAGYELRDALEGVESDPAGAGKAQCPPRPHPPPRRALRRPRPCRRHRLWRGTEGAQGGPERRRGQRFRVEKAAQGHGCRPAAGLRRAHRGAQGPSPQSSPPASSRHLSDLGMAKPASRSPSSRKRSPPPAATAWRCASPQPRRAAQAAERHRLRGENLPRDAGAQGRLRRRIRRRAQWSLTRSTTGVSGRMAQAVAKKWR